MKRLETLINAIMFELRDTYGLEIEKEYIKSLLKESKNVKSTNIKNEIIEKVLDNL